MTSRPLSSRPFVWSVRSTLRHVGSRKHSLLQRLKPQTASAQAANSPHHASAPSSPPLPAVADPSRQPVPSADGPPAASASSCASLPLLLSSPPRARHQPYQRIPSRSCAPRSPHSDGCGRSSARSSSSLPTLTSSRSSDWLAAYNEAWEDGTGVDVDPLSEQHVDYYYVPDDEVQLTLKKQPIPPTVAAATMQRCLADAFPAEWFSDAPSTASRSPQLASIAQHVDQERVTDDGSEEQRPDEQPQQHQQPEQAEPEADDPDDESYTSRLVGLAMLGLYCTQGVEEANCSAVADVSLPPAGTAIDATRTPSLPPRTQSSRARSEFNDVNPQLVSRRSSTSSTSASPTLSSTPAYLCSPTLSPLTSSPSITPAFAYSPATSSPDNCDNVTFHVPPSTTLSPLPSPAASSPLPLIAPTNGSPMSDPQHQSAPFDESMHQRVCQRLRSRLAVDGSTLSDKRLLALSSSSSSSQSSIAAICVIDERTHHDRFVALTTQDGILCLSAADLPSPQSWLHLGSYLLSTPRVSSLSFQSVCITSAELEMLGHAALSFIRALSFTDNSIGLRPYTLSKLVDILAACELLQLEYLSIAHNSLSALDPLDHLVSQHPMLRTLSLPHNAITNEGALTLANAMRRLAASHHFTDLSALDLAGNRIDAQGVAGLLAARDELARQTGMDVDVGVAGMRQYVGTPVVGGGGGVGGMSPLALLPLTARLFPAPLTLLGQAALDVARVALVPASLRQLTVFRALSLKVMRSQGAGRQTETELEEDRS